MTRWMTLLLVVGLASAPPAMIGGCDTVGDEQGDDTGDDQNTGSCGTRNVTLIPPAGYVEFVTRTELNAVPSDSGLAKVSFHAALCASTTQSQMPRILYEIGENGNVLAMVQLIDSSPQPGYLRTAVSNQQLAITDGCLQNQGQPTGDDGSDPLQPHTNPCGDAAFPVSHDGMVFENVQGEYICVAVDAISSCHDCWYADGVWHQEIVSTGYYVAQGSIDNVSVYGWAAVCDPQNTDATVSIAAGDRVDFTWKMVIEYHSSPTPEELGYQQIVFVEP